jgi:general stress protein 26
MAIKNYEDVSVYALDDDVREHILETQNECSFIWSTKNHSPMGVIMSYVWRDGKFWLTATSQRARIYAIRRDPRVAITVSSVGTDVGPARSISIKGTVNLRDDQATKDWVYPAITKAILGDAPAEVHEHFCKNLDSERRLILEVTPEMWVTYDATKMMVASMGGGSLD